MDVSAARYYLAVKRRPVRNAVALVTVAILTLAMEDSRAQSISDLGLLTGYSTSFATSISGDGAIVVGWCFNGTPGGSRGFRWTASGGMQALPSPFGVSAAFGISADGATVAGRTSFTSGGHACRWVASGAAQDLGVLPGASSSFAVASSADGSVICGYDQDVLNRSWRWTPATGMQDLGIVSASGHATAINSDGSVIVGQASGRAWRWTVAGPLDLGLLPGATYAEANSVSSDGSVVTGESGGQAFRWTSGGRIQNLGMPAGAITSSAAAVSGDGRAVVGSCVVAGEGAACYWDTLAGTAVDLNRYLPSIGVDLTGWSLSQAVGVTAMEVSSSALEH